jgi:hypothetical protein
MTSAEGVKLRKSEPDVDGVLVKFADLAVTSLPDGNSESDTQPTPPLPSSAPAFGTSPRPNCVPFIPEGAKNEPEIKKSFDNIPRYLYHVYDNETNTHPQRKSCGETTKEWVKSKDALDDEEKNIDENDPEYHMVDIFKRTGKAARLKVATGLNEHVRWWTCSSGKNNFVSWTPSMLFAITYAIHRINFMEREPRQVSLCVVDTLELESLGYPRGIFIKDMDLFREYEFAGPEIVRDASGNPRSWRSGGLPNMISFRNMSANKAGFIHGDPTEFFEKGNKNYYGEYLSQGKLKIEGASTIISFDNIIDENLYRLHPFFEALRNNDPSRLPSKPEKFKAYMKKAKTVKGSEVHWARATMMCKDIFYSVAKGCEEPTTVEEINAVAAIIKNVDPRWRFALAASLLALRPRQEDEKLVLEEFHKNFGGKCARHGKRLDAS